MTAPASPCLGLCALDPDTALCRGCARTADEIAGWRGMGDADKRGVLERVAGRRQGASGGGAAPEGHPCTPGAGAGFHGTGNGDFR